MVVVSDNLLTFILDILRHVSMGREGYFDPLKKNDGLTAEDTLMLIG